MGLYNVEEVQYRAELTRLTLRPRVTVVFKFLRRIGRPTIIGGLDESNEMPRNVISTR